MSLINNHNNIAVLITCYNRIDSTIRCLKCLFDQKDINFKFKLDVFLVDDGSSDDTSHFVKKKFPQVNIIIGNGNLYWNRGMRLAWETALLKKQYNYFLWLNNDTFLFKNSICKLLDDYNFAINISNTESIITGACRKEKVNEFSYGGRNEKGIIIPNKSLQKCYYINGNVVLVPWKIYTKINILSNNYTHAFGDIDYGLRAINSGFFCYTTREYIATCEPNYTIQIWCNSQFHLIERWKNFISPKGLNIKEYIYFRKKFWKFKWILYTITAFAKFLFPNIYAIIKRI
jgi:GT2 family glycosyltransferase